MNRYALFARLIVLHSGITGRRPALTPEPGLLDELLAVHNDAIADMARVNAFVMKHANAYSALVAEHSPGSERYVPHRDELYATPECLLLAALAHDKPALMRSRFEYSDFRSPVQAMITEFAAL